MPKVYLLAYTRELGTFQDVRECLNGLPEVITWRKEIPNTFFIVSSAPAGKLAKAIQKALNRENPRFILTELHMSEGEGDTSGWLSTDSWTFIAEHSE